jgi:hypothetical protein
MLKKIIAVGLYVAITTNAGAEVIGLKFTDTSSNIKQTGADSISTDYINPVSAVSFSVSSGLDRKINMILKDNVGSVISNTTSTTVYPLNTFNVDSKDYFGKIIPVTFPQDGRYLLTVNILDYDGAIVQTDMYNYVVDTVAPVITGTTRYKSSGYVTQAYYASFAANNFLNLSLAGMIDNDKIVKSNLVVRKQASGLPFGRVASNLDDDTTRVSHSSYPWALIDGDGSYDVGFEVLDRAGNVAISTEVFVVDNVMPELIFSHVYNPISTLWEVYTPGMTVYENPAKFRVRRKKVDVPAFNGDAPKGWAVNNPYNFSDTNYVYTTLNAHKPASYSHQRYITKASAWTTMSQSSLNFVLGPGVKEAPKMVSISTRVNGAGAFVSSTVRVSTPSTLTDVRVVAQPRPYEQLVAVSGGGTCIIPPTQTQCTISTSYYFDSGKAYQAYPVTIRSSVAGVYDGGMSIHAGYIYTYKDFNGGSFLANSIKEKIVDFTYLDQDRTNNWTKNMWYTSSIKLQAQQVSDGAITIVNTSEFKQTSYNEYQGYFDMSAVTAGFFNLNLVATDSYGNETVLQIASNFFVDNTQPAITITDKGLEGFTEVVGLDDIRIDVQDNGVAGIEEIALSDGPDDTVVYMSWTDSVNNTFKLEYPKIFPSLETGEEYTLTIKTKDDSGNRSEKAVSFMYKPKGLHPLPVIDVLATNIDLHDDVNVGINLIEHKNIRTIEGQFAHGVQDAFFTLNGKSDFNVKVRGITVTPGQTVNIPVNAIQGKVALEVYPMGGIEGTTNYLLEIFKISSIDKFVNDDGYITDSSGETLAGETLLTVKEEVDTMDSTIINKSAIPGLTVLAGGVCETESSPGVLQLGLSVAEKPGTTVRVYLTEAEKDGYRTNCERDTYDYDAELQTCLDEVPDYTDKITETTPAVCSFALANTLCDSVPGGRASILSNGKTCTARPILWGGLCRTDIIDEGILITGYNDNLTCIELSVNAGITANGG